jgi:hypothetical protein
MKNAIKNALINIATDLPAELDSSRGEFNQTKIATIVDMISDEINSFLIINMVYYKTHRLKTLQKLRQCQISYCSNLLHKNGYLKIIQDRKMEHEKAKFNARVRAILHEKHKDEVITVPMVEEAVRIVNIAWHKERIEYHTKCLNELENQVTNQ